MIKIENVIFPSPEQWKAIIMGCRNPLNSWAKSDSEIKYENIRDNEGYFEVGDNDLSLMKRLSKAGTDHRKFMRMIPIYLDITAPLYWWKEFDTYKVGTVANSTSTMHKLTDKEFNFDDFSHEHLNAEPLQILNTTINQLNIYRNAYIFGVDEVDIHSGERIRIDPKDKNIWWQMIQLLPSSYNQKRTILLNYEVLSNMYKSRLNHKLDEWQDFCKWIETLPYSEIITHKGE